jgi:hypothetical protein
MKNNFNPSRCHLFHRDYFFGFGHHFADQGGLGHPSVAQCRQQAVCLCRCHCQKQAAGGLGIEEKILHRLRDTAGKGAEWPP